MTDSRKELKRGTTNIIDTKNYTLQQSKTIY